MAAIASHLKLGLACAGSLIWTHTRPLAAAATPGVDTRPGPPAVVQPVGLGEVRWTHGFWADRLSLCRTQAIPAMQALMCGTNHTQFFRNFEIAAGRAEGQHRGAPFNDGDFYKWIEAASALLAVTPDPTLDRQLDQLIEGVAAAQRSDGYLHTPVLIRQRHGDTNAAAFSDRNHFELYNLGHLFTAAAIHHRSTGKTTLLTVAVRAADFLSATLRSAPPEAARSSVCPSHYLGLVELYRETREPRYLELAGRLFEERHQIPDGGDDNQDRIPFRQQTQAVGHAVRANYLYAGAADLFLETGDPTLWPPLDRIWQDVTRHKLYLTGGCGALYDGASPDGARAQKTITRVHQAYGRNYQLPNITAHSETCANIGQTLWNWRMFAASGAARFVDVAELALYNSVLSGLGLDGASFFYVNPLRTTDPLPSELRWPHERVPFLSAFCCPPNVLRTLTELGGYAYSKSPGSLWVNLYGGSRLSTELPGLGPVELTQDTDYPWTGRVRITLGACPAAEFSLRLRLPGWAHHATVRLNQGPPGSVDPDGSDSPLPRPSPAGPSVGGPPSCRSTSSTTNGYFEIRRVWQAGDVIDLELPMPVQWVEANPLVEETLRQVAFLRGPVVYCLESPDLPAGLRVRDVAIPSEAPFHPHYDRRLLGGVTVLRSTLLAQAGEDWHGRLYRELRRPGVREVRTQLVPYAFWANRGRSEMTVWLPRATLP